MLQFLVSTVDWTAKTSDLYSILEDVAKDKIARNALKGEQLSTAVRRIELLNREPAREVAHTQAARRGRSQETP